MSVISINLPESLHRQMQELAGRDHISPDQFAASAIAEKIAALMTEEYLEERARRGDRNRFEQALARVPDRPPEPGDEL